MVITMNWKFYDTSFDYEYYTFLLGSSPWAGHRYFAYDLVRFMKPKKIVELGTYLGSSFFSFCHAVKDAKIDSECYAVDTWIGDPHSGMYGEEIYQMALEIAAKYYPNIAKLIRNTFDGALSMFQDNSLDLLHIDGYHTYEAVSHDLQAWLPKLSEKGVILFHDIAVRSGDFGVYRLWENLKTKYPYVEFEHSSGLGVLFPKGYDPIFNDVFDIKDTLPAIYIQKTK
jgi:hypothetical protein